MLYQATVRNFASPKSAKENLSVYVHKHNTDTPHMYVHAPSRLRYYLKIDLNVLYKGKGKAHHRTDHEGPEEGVDL